MSSSPQNESCADPLCAHSPCLTELGWDSDWAATLAAVAPAGAPGRVARVDAGACTLLTAAGSRRVPATRNVLLAVGDWVACLPGEVAAGSRAGAGDGSRAGARDGSRAGALDPGPLVPLPRRTAIVRRSAGRDPHPQVLAANVETIFVLVALDGRISPRLIDRYVALSWESGATPVVVLTKADLVPGDTAARVMRRMASRAPAVPVHAVSARTGHNFAALSDHLRSGKTAALLGPSGAGKSTLINRIVGTNLATGEMRADGRGRHTTTYRELFLLATGGMLVDTPGLREVGLWQADEGVRRAFEEITGLLGDCRFADCSHTSEPGCALLAALDDGRVTQDRVASWRKLGRELDRISAREDPKLQDRLRAEQRRRHRELAQARKHWRKPMR